MVPESASDTRSHQPRARPVATHRRCVHRGTRTPRGYAFAIGCLSRTSGESSREPFRLGVVVNEMRPDRERRRGQLVLGGAAGEFVYLRGDRLAAERSSRVRHRPMPESVLSQRPRRPVRAAEPDQHRGGHPRDEEHGRARRCVSFGRSSTIRTGSRASRTTRTDIIERIQHFDDLDAALADCVYVAAYTARRRRREVDRHRSARIRGRTILAATRHGPRGDCCSDARTRVCRTRRSTARERS